MVGFAVFPTSAMMPAWTPSDVEDNPPLAVTVVPLTAPVEATEVGVIAPRASVSAGVAPPDDVPDTPFAGATETPVTVPALTFAMTKASVATFVVLSPVVCVVAVTPSGSAGVPERLAAVVALVAVVADVAEVAVAALPLYEPPVISTFTLLPVGLENVAVRPTEFVALLMRFKAV
jgi:hypothetical protein